MPISNHKFVVNTLLRYVMRKTLKLSVYILALTISVVSCKPDKPRTGETTQNNTDKPAKETKPPVQRPTFSADTAYMYIQKQVDFGPRVPGTVQHAKCAQYLFNELKKYADNVMMQQGEATTFDNTKITIKNIIGEINPEAKNRVLLFAHWDTRPFADEDTKDQDKPILGANDGASGVGILLEVARQLQAKRPNWGVDIIFFDAEDWGNPKVDNSYCLGSQFWGRTQHKPNYKANYGILLDMAGGTNATFLMEGISKQTAPQVLQNVWQTAHQLGYYNYFLYTDHWPITDDHYYVNKATGIPCVDIIHIEPGGSFGSFWHTHNDNMDVISKNTLQAVGETLLQVVYNEK